MYTAEHGVEKSYGVTVKKWENTSLDLVGSKTQAGVGLSKDLGHGWTAGVGVATEWTKWDPDWMAYLMKDWTF